MRLSYFTDKLDFREIRGFYHVRKPSVPWLATFVLTALWGWTIPMLVVKAYFAVAGIIYAAGKLQWQITKGGPVDVKDWLIDAWMFIGPGMIAWATNYGVGHVAWTLALWLTLYVLGCLADWPNERKSE